MSEKWRGHAFKNKKEEDVQEERSGHFEYIINLCYVLLYNSSFISDDMQVRGYMLVM